MGDHAAGATSDVEQGVRTGGRPRVSVVVPALNEARNLPAVFARMPPDVDELLLVDGHSIDGTIDVARALRPDVRVIQQCRRGKGNALACGFSAARGDIIVALDADGSTDPQEVPAFVAALTAGAHFAKGSRFASGGGSDDITRVRRSGNFVLNALVNALYRTRWSDLCYGYNAFWADCLPYLDLVEQVIELEHGERLRPRAVNAEVRWGDGFEIETLLSVRVHRAGMIVAEVPSFESPRLHGASNLNAFRDGVRVLRTIAVERRRLGKIGGPGGDLPRPWERFRRGRVPAGEIRAVDDTPSAPLDVTVA